MSPMSHEPPAAQATGVPVTGEMDYSRCTVLVVDDNAPNVELMQAYLEPLGCRVLTAGNGMDAIGYIEDAGAQGPDLVLLDVMMPRMSGFEVCRKIKEDPSTRDIPVIMVTALSELGDVERGVESGTDDFLTKPVDKRELLDRVRTLLRLRMLHKDLDRGRPPLES